MINPLISVIMPVYNAEKRLRVSIDSVLEQKYTNIELILINDGSTDRSKEICDEYILRDPRVVVIHKRNSGVSNARNSGMEIAKGEYFTFVDSDDRLNPIAYGKAVSYIENNQDIDILIFGMRFEYYISDKLIKFKDMSINKNIAISKEMINQFFFELYDQNYLSSSCNKMIRSSIIKENNIRFDSNMAILEDFNFTLDLLKQSKQIVAIQDVYYHYYHDATVSSFSRRPNIDYLQNFKILDNNLRKFSQQIGIRGVNELEKLNTIIFRNYIIGVQKLFSSNASNSDKYKQLRRYVLDHDINKAADQANTERLRLKLVTYLFRKQRVKILFLLFSITYL